MVEQLENEHGECRNATPIIRVPDKPTKEEWERHQITHTPYAAWCPHCVAARNARRNHPTHGRKGKIVPDTETEEGPTKVSMDYMYLHERVGKYREMKHNPPYLVVVEHQRGRCWAHQVPNKGVNDGAYWVPKRVLQDLENNGFGKAQLLVKTDQEPSIVCVQRALQDFKSDIIPINSPLGESACNGRVGNAIRRVQEKTRVLRHQLEHCIGEILLDQLPIMAWMARWAAELISKYVPGDDGKTPYGRIRKERCMVPLANVGEVVMYLPMKIARESKGTPARKFGIWLGVIERTEETIIGTKNGVVKCRTISRLSEDDQWNKELILQMRCSPWELVLGKQNMNIPVDVDDDGEDPEGDNGSEIRPTGTLDDDVPVETRGGLDKLHIFRKAIIRYGSIVGFPGCNDLARRGPGQQGKINYHHSNECRARIIEHMKGDPEYRRLLEKHGYIIGMVLNEALTKVQVNEKKHQVQKAMAEIERKERQCMRGYKEGQLNCAMRQMMFENMEVAEIYSPPRITKRARRMGLRAGWSFDLTTCDENGRPWDFNCKEMGNAVVRKVIQDKPILWIGSPMGGPFGMMNNFNYACMIEEEKRQNMAYGRLHLEFCAQLYELQWREGRYCLHEHLDAASSWKEECITNMMRRQGVIRVTGDQCRYGLKFHDGSREGPARKRIRFLTNSPCVAKRLSLKCPNVVSNQVHEHVVLINGRARVAQVYTPEFCRAVCKGLMEQLEADRKGQFLLANVMNSKEADTKSMMEEAGQMKDKCRTAEEDNDQQFEIAWDDVSGAEFDPKVVRKARGEEIEFVRKMNVYTKVIIEECYKNSKSTDHSSLG